MKKTVCLLLLLVFLFPLTVRAAVLKPTYPRLANYFLKWRISDAEARELAKWDVLVLDMELARSSRPQLELIKRLHPGIIMLAYITSQEILDDIDDYNDAPMRQALASQIAAGWYLRDAAGRRVVNWPGTSMLNLSDQAPADYLGRRFNDYLPEFVAGQLQGSGLWDGVFYDNAWGDVSWVNRGDLDFNSDGQAETPAVADQLWASGFKKMLETTRRLTGNEFIIVGNGRVYYGYQSLLNGMMLEDFPSSWENGGTWSGSIATYLKLPELNRNPQISIINNLDRNSQNYRNFRFTLASALLGEGFYSFDSDSYNHGQTWWYDEYDVNLGPAQSAPYNLLSSRKDIGPGLWRRDFKNGVAIVNSTETKQKFVFAKEELERIRGEQDPAINSGARVNYIELEPSDGIILRKQTTVIKNNTFLNGYFYRVFDLSGQRAGNGFFSYAGGYPGNSSLVLVSNGEEQETGIMAAGGQLSLSNNGRTSLNLKPYGNLFRGQLNLSASIESGQVRALAVGPGPGGGPQVAIFSPSGRLLASFFAYDKKLRGGVSVALGDLDGDGQLELVAAPGAGSEPLIKIFDGAGRLKRSFLAYSQKFRGAVNISLGDLNGDGQKEIITAPGEGGGPEIRIFDHQGNKLSSFFAYDQNFRGGVTVSASDLDADGQDEILVGLKNFY